MEKRAEWPAPGRAAVSPFPGDIVPSRRVEPETDDDRKWKGIEAIEAVDTTLTSFTLTASVLMQRLSYPTETVLSNNITRNIKYNSPNIQRQS